MDDNLRDIPWMKFALGVVSIVFACGVVFKTIAENTKAIQANSERIQAQEIRIVNIEKWIVSQTEYMKTIDSTLQKIEQSIDTLPDIRAKMNYLVENNKREEKP